MVLSDERARGEYDSDEQAVSSITNPFDVHPEREALITKWFASPPTRGREDLHLSLEHDYKQLRSMEDTWRERCICLMNGDGAAYAAAAEGNTWWHYTQNVRDRLVRVVLNHNAALEHLSSRVEEFRQTFNEWEETLFGGDAVADALRAEIERLSAWLREERKHSLPWYQEQSDLYIEVFYIKAKALQSSLIFESMMRAEEPRRVDIKNNELAHLSEAQVVQRIRDLPVAVAPGPRAWMNSLPECDCVGDVPCRTHRTRRNMSTRSTFRANHMSVQPQMPMAEVVPQPPSETALRHGCCVPHGLASPPSSPVITHKKSWGMLIRRKSKANLAAPPAPPAPLPARYCTVCEDVINKETVSLTHDLLGDCRREVDTVRIRRLRRMRRLVYYDLHPNVHQSGSPLHRHQYMPDLPSPTFSVTTPRLPRVSQKRQRPVFVVLSRPGGDADGQARTTSINARSEPHCSINYSDFPPLFTGTEDGSEIIDMPEGMEMPQIGSDGAERDLRATVLKNVQVKLVKSRSTIENLQEVCSQNPQVEHSSSCTPVPGPSSSTALELTVCTPTTPADPPDPGVRTASTDGSFMASTTAVESDCDSCAATHGHSEGDVLDFASMSSVACVACVTRAAGIAKPLSEVAVPSAEMLENTPEPPPPSHPVLELLTEEPTLRPEMPVEYKPPPSRLRSLFPSMRDTECHPDILLTPPTPHPIVSLTANFRTTSAPTIIYTQPTTSQLKRIIRSPARAVATTRRKLGRSKPTPDPLVTPFPLR